jgi:hypothetical protein
VSASLTHRTPFEVTLRSHEYIADVRVVGRWVLVVPSAEGLRILIRYGKKPLVAAWQEYVGTGSSVATDLLEWRLLETLPPPDSAAEFRCSEPVRSPIVTALQRSAAAALKCRVRVPYDLAIFDGHFPSLPILPGVVQVEWAVQIAHAHLRMDGQFKGITATKFRRLVRPGMELALTLGHRPAPGELRFEYLIGDALASIGRVFFRDADD